MIGFPFDLIVTKVKSKVSLNPDWTYIGNVDYLYTNIFQYVHQSMADRLLKEIQIKISPVSSYSLILE